MKRWQFVLLALAWFGCFGDNAWAQFVVSDPEAEAAAAATSAGVDALNGGVETLNASVRELIGHISVPRTATDGLPVPVPLTATAIDPELYNSQLPLTTPGLTVYTEGVKNLLGTDAEAALLREELAGSANAVGVVNTNSALLDTRLEASEATWLQLGAAPDLMQATVNVGIMAKRTHDATILAAQAAYFNALVTSQSNVNRVKEAMQQRDEHMKTLVLFGASFP